MSEGGTASGLRRHFILCLGLNFRSKQAIVYGYLVPLLFLVAFGSVFRAETPMLLDEMGQLMTITILGGACFGMPTALVAERERGIWAQIFRRLPVPTAVLVADVLAVRIVLVASRGGTAGRTGPCLAYGTAAAAAHRYSRRARRPRRRTSSFPGSWTPGRGLGGRRAGSAGDGPVPVPADDHDRGVGIPLLARFPCGPRGFQASCRVVTRSTCCSSATATPWAWPEGVSASLRSSSSGLSRQAFPGPAFFDGTRVGMSAGRPGSWLGAALAAWVAIGIAAAFTGRLVPDLPPDNGYEAVTEAEIGAITYDNLPGDSEFVSRLARPFPVGKPSGISDFCRSIERLATGPDSRRRPELPQPPLRCRHRGREPGPPRGRDCSAASCSMSSARGWATRSSAGSWPGSSFIRRTARRSLRRPSLACGASTRRG